ncbi:hypothetical protein KCG48_05025 [Proteiniclasticum sp. BAD-10]|uniref:Uncharacterized protein n=1 Tax=Proteiniclasticum sediminis TaxID=2804028 RepID=A0A941CQW1_9CLOT|nr:hypothetical protein [Proteiniclasticum sediminis]MBR0575703.1 hypothetical protein [Proteiniclasticum sediminis]
MMQPSIKPKDYPEMIRRIKASKEAQGITTPKLAKKANISEGTLRRLLIEEPVNIFAFLQVLDALGLEIQII